MLTSVAIFTLGSGICGGSNSANMLIAGRAVQGIGAGGINMLIDLIVCDLVPLRERSQFVGLLFIVVSVGSALGPYIGGAIVDSTTWRWVFYFNLPFGGLSFGMLWLFLHTGSHKGGTFAQKLKRIDYIGNAIVMGSTVAILFALTYGGTRYPWSSGRIIAPLVIGLIGLVVFYLFERTKWCPEPVLPPRLFGNVTSAMAYFITFQHSVVTFWILYFFPVYFQAVLGSSPSRAGVQMLPTVTVFAPFAAIAGGIVAKTGRYRPIHQLGFIIITVSVGCLSLLDQNSHTAVWVILQGLTAVGLGMVISTLLPAVQVGLPESEAASTSAAWAFVRSLGIIWGVSVPAAIFNNRFDQLLSGIEDPNIRSQLANGQAYQHASRDFLNSFSPDIRNQLITIYSESLKRSWQIAVVFAGTAFLATFAEKELKLRTELETEYGLENPAQEGQIEKAEATEEKKN
jgi:MFS family permease